MMSSQLPNIRKSKPTKDIADIIDALKDRVKVRHGQKNRRVSLNFQGKKQVILLIEGHISLARQQDLRTLSTMRAPVVLGTGVPEDQADYFIIRAISEIKYALIPIELFNQYLEEFNLWKQQTANLTWMLMSYHLYNNVLINNDHNKTARILLDALYKEPEIVRANTTVLAYLQERTLLSRSWIMRFISDLKKSGYLETKKGILIKINK
ncbi:helix-turn-helix domain-containing protein [Klebsiella aerogenes]|nr:helix-turn-helix domain-containing protein [Klebsiella aerogenes]